MVSGVIAQLKAFSDHPTFGLRFYNPSCGRGYVTSTAIALDSWEKNAVEKKGLWKR
jgi:hypothetical protein